MARIPETPERNKKGWWEILGMNTTTPEESHQ
jgi:hypothetical protein